MKRATGPPKIKKICLPRLSLDMICLYETHHEFILSQNVNIYRIDVKDLYKSGQAVQLKT